MSDTHAHDHAHAEVHPPAPHVVPVKVLAAVLAGLLFFTFLTVAATWVDLGKANIIVALGIAVIKGALVVLFFMHLRWESPFYGLVLCVALGMVALFIGMTLMDSTSYQAVIRAAQQALPK